MSAVGNKLLTDFPVEIKYLVSEHLTIKDLSNCCCVSHFWKNLFDSDFMWESSAKKFGVKKLEINLIHQFLIETQMLFKSMPINLKNHLANDYKSLSRRKFLLDETENIRKKYPLEFLKVFNGEAKAIQRLPALKIHVDERIDDDHNYFKNLYHFKDEHFSSPIVRVTIKNNDNQEVYFMLFRIINNETGKIYRDAISFYSFSGNRYFNIDKTKWGEDRIICPKYALVTEEKLNRLQRLIRREPVGIIVADNQYTIREGPKTIFFGKSVLELC